jgi:DNA-binding transcriptional ArsR family regulator
MALANPTRLRILERLADAGEESVNDLARYLHMSQPRISWHLRMLRLGGAVRTRRTGRLVYCSLDREAIRLRLAALGEMLGLDEAVEHSNGIGAGTRDLAAKKG